MTVREAVIEAFCKDGWITFPEEPTSVDVYFVNKEGFSLENISLIIPILLSFFNFSSKEKSVFIEIFLGKIA